MNFRPVSLILVVTLGVWSGLRAETPPSTPPAHAGKHAKPEKPETELEKTMSTMGKAWRQVRKEARDGQLSAATAKLVATIRTNAEADGELLEQVAAPEPEGRRLLTQAVEKFKLSARGYHRVLRVARTLADLDGTEQIGRLHLAEALSYRALADDLRRAA